jgi:hypothetical protein
MSANVGIDLKQARTNNGNRRKAICGAPNRLGAHRVRHPEAEEGAIADRGLRK